MSTDLTGKTALVTGSTSGIGRATATALALRGAHVIVTGPNRDRGAATVAAIREAGGKADFLQADLDDVDEIDTLARQAVETGGGHIDILVNNAGIYPFGPSNAFTAAQFDTAYHANVKAPFLLTNALAPAMATRGDGVIINMSTALATKGTAGASVYASSKAAIETLTKVWSAEWGPSGVRVNAVSPGPVATEGTAPFGAALSQFYIGTPAGRAGQPEEIAAAVVFLASDEARYIHGAIVPIDGGVSTL